MHIVQVPSALPGVCFICNSSNRSSYIDTQMSVDIDGPTFPGPVGAVYICNACVSEFAGMYGFLSEDEYKDIKIAKTELEQLNYELIKRVGALEESLSAMANAGYQRISDDNSSLDGRTDISDYEDAAGEFLSREEDLGTGAGETTESSDDEGMAELRPTKSESTDFDLGI